MRLEVHSAQRAPRLEHHHGLHTLLAVLPHVKLQLCTSVKLDWMPPGPSGRVADSRVHGSRVMLLYPGLHGFPNTILQRWGSFEACTCKHFTAHVM